VCPALETESQFTCAGTVNFVYIRVLFTPDLP
jgi:hypothetical protein